MQHFWLKSIRLLVVPPKHFLPVEAEDDEFPMRTKHTISFFQFSLVETEKTSDYNNEESRANRKKHHHILNTVLSTEYIEKDGRKLSQRHLLKSYMNFCNPNLLKETTFSLPLDASSSLVAGRHILHRNFIKLQWLASIFHLAWNDLNKVSFH